MPVPVSSEQRDSSSRTRATDGDGRPFTDVAQLLDLAQSKLEAAGRDRPRSGQGLFFPVLGARRAIGVIYADNGRRPSSIQDGEIVELATAQVGLAFENELLRRQVSRSAREAAS